MLFWMALVAGLIIGWLVEWMIDWRFWRKDLNQSLDEEQRWRLELAQARREISDLKAQVAQLASQTSGSEPVAPQYDNFERIKGISRIFAQRLQAADIHTYAELAQLPAKRILEIVRPEPRQAVEPAAWIAQARKLAQKQQEAS